MPSILKFWANILTNRCMEPTCHAKATEHPHGIPCCDRHAHATECSGWVGGECDCGKEGP